MIGLNRPDKMNAFNVRMLEELAEAYTILEKEHKARCGLLFAHGKHFTSGLDLGEVGPAIKEGKKLFPDEKVDPVQLHGKRGQNL